jgi:hypothetical protein
MSVTGHSKPATEGRVKTSHFGWAIRRYTIWSPGSRLNSQHSPFGVLSGHACGSSSLPAGCSRRDAESGPGWHPPRRYLPAPFPNPSEEGRLEVTMMARHLWRETVASHCQGHRDMRLALPPKGGPSSKTPACSATKRAVARSRMRGLGNRGLKDQSKLSRSFRKNPSG